VLDGSLKVLKKIELKKFVKGG